MGQSIFPQKIEPNSTNRPSYTGQPPLKNTTAATITTTTSAT